MSLILNTNSGILHLKPCADGMTGNTPVTAGSRKPYSKYEMPLETLNIKKIIIIPAV